MSEINDEKEEKREKYKELLIRKLGIFELRALAREVGISAPTTRRRSELVDLILSKMQNGELNTVPLGKKGRPFKKLSSLDELLSTVTADHSENNIIERPMPVYEELICFAQELPDINCVLGETKYLKGVIRKAETTFYFVDIDDNIKAFVPEDLAVKFRISDGDFVHAECNKINNNGQFLVASFKKINFIDTEQYVIADAELGLPIIARESLDYGDGEVYIGRRNLVLYNEDIFEDERFVNLSKQCQEKNIKILVLGLNISFENEIMYKSDSSLVNMTTSYGSTVASGVDKVIDTIALAQKLLSRGHKVLIFLNDVIEIMRVLDLYYGNKDLIEGHTAESIVVMKKLLSLGRAYENGLSTTVLISFRTLDSEDKFLNNEIMKISRKV